MTIATISLESEFHKIARSSGVLGDSTGKPAYLYIRSSDKIQSQEGSESLSRQLLVAHEKASTDGRYVPLSMTFWDIWRGKDTDRPAFQQLLTDAKEQKRSDVVYIDQTDRLSRDRAVYSVLLHDLTRYGLSVRFATEEDELTRHIKLVFDEIELEKRRYRQINANRARATKGQVTSKFATYGYHLSEDKLSYVIYEEEAQWVRQIFSWYVSGKALKWITGTLSARKILTPLGKKIWSPESVRGMLRREVYKGVFIANRYERIWIWENGKQKRIDRLKPENEWIYLSVPALVTEEQWDEAQKILSTNKQKATRNSTKREWLLSGLVRCVCGNSVIAKHKRDRKKLASGDTKLYPHNFYVCWHHMEKWRPDCCIQPKIAKSRLEQYVLEAIEMLLVRTNLWQASLDHPDNQVERWKEHVQLCAKQINEIDAQTEALLQLTLEQRTEHMRQLFAQKQKELESQREKYVEQMKVAEDRLALAQQAIDQRVFVEDLLGQLRQMGGLANLPDEVKRQILLRIVDEITLNTKECWFEIRGVLRDVGDRFCYDTDGQVVSMSGFKPCR